MHDKGLKLGIYEDYGTKTCGGYPGSLDHLKIDAETFAAWDVDLLKLDGCNIPVSKMHIGFPEMGRLLMGTGRDIVYSCEWPLYAFRAQRRLGTLAEYEEVGKACNFFRNFDDIFLAWKWGTVMNTVHYYVAQQDILSKVNGPGQWNDPDMLIVGNTELTLDQSEAQMAIWSIWSAPLFMSNDLRWMPDGYAKILLNRKVIAVDQDPLGKMGLCISNASNVFTFVKPMTPYIKSGPEYSYAVAFLNTNTAQLATVSARLDSLGLRYPAGYMVEDLYKGTRHGLLKPSSTFTCKVRFAPSEIKESGWIVEVNPTGVCLIKATIAAKVFTYNYD